MKERPILFSGPMVQALLAGRKTQTRRAMKLQPDDDGVVDVGTCGHTRGVAHVGNKTDGGHRTRVPCPYGAPGDQLWVRENGWERPYRTPTMLREGADTWSPYYYDADGYTDADGEQFKAWGFKRRPSIHMPRWASRISLYITSVRVQRLQDISDTDAKAEGIEPFGDGWKHYFFPDEPRAAWEFATNSYASLWDKINGAGSWASNPWVWVLEFMVERPVSRNAGHVAQPCTASGVPVASQIARQP